MVFITLLLLDYLPLEFIKDIMYRNALRTSVAVLGFTRLSLQHFNLKNWI